MTVTAAQAIANYNANNNVAAQAVADTSADLLSHLAGLQTMQVHGKLASVTLGGTSNVVSVSQLTSLSGLTGFAVATGAKLTVNDSASNLLTFASSANAVFATSVLLTGFNLVTVADANTLAGLAHFGIELGATLNVTGSATSLLGASAAALAVATAVYLTGITNSVSAVQAATLAGLTGFGLAEGASLTVTDNAADLLANPSGLLLAGIVTLTGSNVVTAAQAATLGALNGFGLALNAVLLVSDNATNLLAHAGALIAATGVDLAGYNSVSIAQAVTLAALPGFSLANGASLIVTGSAAALLTSYDTSAAWIPFATGINLSGLSNIVGAADATTLAGLTGFIVPTDASLIVSDGAVNLLANSAGTAVATSVIMTGTANPVNIAGLSTLEALPNFAIGLGASVAVTDSSEAISQDINNLQALAAAGELSSIDVGDEGQITLTYPQFLSDTNALALITLNSLTVTRVPAAAAQAVSADPSVTFFYVADDAVDLLASPNYLHLATAIFLTGTNDINPSQAGELALLPSLTLGWHATLNVAGSSAAITENLGALQSFAAAGDLTSVTDTDAFAAQITIGYAQYVDDTAALALVSNPLVVIGVPAAAVAAIYASSNVVSFTVTDSAANLLNVAYASDLGFAAGVTMTGTANPVNLASLATLEALPDFAIGLNASVAVSDYSGAIAADIDNLQTLAAAGELSSIHVEDPGQLTITYAQFVDDSTALALITDNYLIVTDVPAAAAGTVHANENVASFSVADSAADLLAFPVYLPHASAIVLTGTNYVDALQAGELTLLPTFTLGLSAALNVSDNSSDIVNNLNALQTLAAAGDLTSITDTSGGAITISYAQYTNDVAALALISNPLAVTGVPTAAAESVAGNGNVASVAVGDNAAGLLATPAALDYASSITLTGINVVGAAEAGALALLPLFSLGLNSVLEVIDSGPLIATNIDALQDLATASDLTSITVTNPLTSPVTITYGQFVSDGTALGLINDNYNLVLTGVPAIFAEAVSVAPHVASYSVADNAANLLDDDLGDPTSAILNGTANTVSTGQLATLMSLNYFGIGLGATFAVSDTAGNIATDLATLEPFAVADQISAITVSPAAPVAITYAQFLADPAMIALIGASDTLTVSGVPISGISAVSGNPSIGSFAVADSLSNLLGGSVGAATSVAATGTASVTIAQLAQLTALPNFSLAYGATLEVYGTAATISVNLDTLQALGNTGDITSIVITDSNPLSLTYTQYTNDLTALNLISSNYTLLVSGVPAADAQIVHSNSYVTSFTVSDSANNLLNPSYLAWVRDASSVSLSGPNNVSVATANSLTGLPGFGLGFGATLVVQDNLTDLLAPVSPGLADATSSLLTGSNTVSAQTASKLGALRGFGLASGATLVVSDTAAHLLTNSYAVGIGFASSVVLTGTSNAVTALQASTLGNMPLFSLFAGAHLAVSDTAAHLLTSAYAAGIAHATSVTLTGTANSVTAAQAETLATMPAFTRPGATLAITDTSANLLSGANAAGIAAATGVTLTGTSNVVTLLQDQTLVGMVGFSYGTGAKLAVSDTASNLSSGWAKLETLVTAGNVSAVTISDGNALTLTYQQLTSGANVIAELPLSYKLVLNGAPVSAASALWTSWHTNTFTVTDTVANIAPALAALNHDTKLTAVNVTPTVGDYTLNLTGFTKPVSINLGVDSASASSPLTSANVSFVGTIDALTLGTTTNAVIQYALESYSGIETVTGFQYGTDQLDINLLGALSSTLEVFNTMVGGVHALAITSSADQYQGIVLLGMPSNETAFDLLQNHLTFSGGYAVIT